MLFGNVDHPLFTSKRAAALRARPQILQLRFSDHLGTLSIAAWPQQQMPVIR
jgi:hypothetical protein